MSTINVFLIDDQLGTNDDLANAAFAQCKIATFNTSHEENEIVHVLRNSGQVRKGNTVRNDVEATLAALVEKGSVSNISLVLLDMRFDSGVLDEAGIPSGNADDERFGYVLHKAIKSQYPDLPIVFISTYAQAEIGDETLNYLAKSDITDQSLSLCLLRFARLNAEQRNKLLNLQDEIVASDGLLSAYITAFEMAPLPIPVLITGETGSGKEVLARYVHKQSERNGKAFIAINVNAIPRELFEDTFFGHERGAFTGATEPKPGLFELADGGSLFLDEIGDLPLDLQVKLLRVLETGVVRRIGGKVEIPVDVRLIAATNNMDEQGGVKGLREDLKYRLSGQPIHIPPLRERREDIIPLATKMLENSCQKFKKHGLGFGESAIQALQQYAFLGNARELLNRVSSAVARTGNRTLITAQSLGISPENVVEQEPSKDESQAPEQVEDLSSPSNSSFREWLDQGLLIKIPTKLTDLDGIKKPLDMVVARLNHDLALAALDATRHPVTKALVPTTAMQHISSDPEIKGAKPKRLLAQMLGRLQDGQIENDELNELIAAWKLADKSNQG